MKRKICMTFRYLSVLLAANLATPQPGQLGTVLIGALVGAGCLATAAADEIRDISPSPRSEPAAPATPPAGLRFPASPTDAEISAARIFDEPLVPTDGEPQPAQNQALAAALLAYANRATADDCSSLADFANNYPQSRWTPSLLLHLGTEYYNYGYFSKALDAWQRAWAQFKTSNYAGTKAQADRALGELARMYARIGRAAQLSDLLDSVQGRDLAGPGGVIGSPDPASALAHAEPA